jgi:hypothetical protein
LFLKEQINGIIIIIPSLSPSHALAAGTAHESLGARPPCFCVCVLGYALMIQLFLLSMYASFSTRLHPRRLQHRHLLRKEHIGKSSSQPHALPCLHTHTARTYRISPTSTLRTFMLSSAATCIF